MNSHAPEFLQRIPEGGGPAIPADRFSERYLSGDIPSRDLTTFQWTHRVVPLETDVVRLHHPIHRGCVIPFGSAFLRRILSEAFREKLNLLSYGTLASL